MPRQGESRIESIFDAAVDLPAAEQAVFLDDICAGEPSLRRMLQALLHAARLPDEGLPRRRVDPPGSAMRSLGPGARIGSYRITDKIGEGGMGVVYAAVHVELSRRAVVKVLQRSLVQDDDMVQRFGNEARAAASIRHPGIVDVIDVGRHECGDLYILMEYLEGESLKSRLRRVGQMPEETALSLIRQASGALSAVHEMGIVHRDLKPDNLFLVPDPEVTGGERVKILDFGIAKLREQPSERVTQSGILMGTPPYMAPEQCRGWKDLDHRADLYALGIILFELVCGRRPFEKTSSGDYLFAHISEPPPPMERFVPDVRPDVSLLTARLLAKDRDQRFSSAQALIDALDATGPTVPVLRPPELAMSAFDTVFRRKLKLQPATCDAPASPLRTWLRKRAWPRGLWRISGWLMAAMAACAMVVLLGQARVDPPVPTTPLTVQGLHKQLRALLDTGRPDVQREVVEALRQVGTSTLEARKLLERALGHGPPQVRVDAARALCELGKPDAAPRVRAAFNQSGGRVQVHMAAAMMCLNDLDSRAVLEKFLDEPGVSLIAAEALAAAGAADREALAVLHKQFAELPTGGAGWLRAARGLLLADSDDARVALVRELSQMRAHRAVAAAGILARAGDAEAIDYLHRQVDDWGFAARGEAAQALARVGDTAALQFVGDGLNSDDPRERRLAITAAGRLAEHGGRRFVRRVHHLLLHDSDSTVRIAARVALLALVSDETATSRES